MAKLKFIKSRSDDQMVNFILILKMIRFAELETKVASKAALASCDQDFRHDLTD